MPVKLTPRHIDPSFFNPRADTACAWLGMAGLLVNARGTILFIDPLITVTELDGVACSETGLKLKVPLPIEAKDVPRADLVMYTHAENDHCGTLTPGVLEKRCRPKFLGPPPVHKRLRKAGVEESRMLTARDFETFRVGGVEIQVTPALHDHDPTNPWKRGDCSGYLLRTPDGAIWHPGDTRLIDELLTFRDVDVLLWDVSYNVNAHLCPPGSAAIARTSGAKVLLAYHYGTMEAPEDGGYRRALESDPEDSLPYLKDLKGRFLILNPGEILHLPDDL